MDSTFGLAVDRWCKGAVVNVDTVGRKVALEVFTRVIKRTPVKTGRARGNWQCSIGSPALDAPSEGFANEMAQTFETDTSGNRAVAQSADEVKQWKPSDGSSIFLANNVPYIEVLEQGRHGNKGSWQAPNGMVAITIAEYGGIAENAAAQARAGTFGGSRSETSMGGAWDVGSAGE